MVEGVHGAFSLATAQAFWLGVFGSVVAFGASLAIKEIPLRTSNEQPVPTQTIAQTAAQSAAGAASSRPSPSRSRPAPSSATDLSLLLARDDPGGPHRGRCASRDYDAMTMDPRPTSFPPHLGAPGTADAAFEAVLAVADLPPGTMRRVTRGDLDILLANTPSGIVATDDRCPHMSAPLSIGELDGCVVACPLHEGRFDLCTGETVQMPTTGGLDADGVYRPTWSPAGREAKVDPPGKKAEARRLTRVRRLRYYPLRIVAGMIEIAFPRE